MQLRFRHKAVPNATPTGARPIGLRALSGWIVLCLLPVCMALIFVQAALAADTGAKTATNVVSSGSNWVGFTVGNLNTSDDNWATNSTDTDYGVVSTFGFGVPTDAQIDGIQVDVEGS